MAKQRKPHPQKPQKPQSKAGKQKNRPLFSSVVYSWLVDLASCCSSLIWGGRRLVPLFYEGTNRRWHSARLRSEPRHSAASTIQFGNKALYKVEQRSFHFKFFKPKSWKLYLKLLPVIVMLPFCAYLMTRRQKNDIVNIGHRSWPSRKTFLNTTWVRDASIFSAPRRGWEHSKKKYCKWENDKKIHARPT